MANELAPDKQQAVPVFLPVGAAAGASLDVELVAALGSKVGEPLEVPMALESGTADDKDLVVHTIVALG